jgi:anti-anti-sigma factor
VARKGIRICGKALADRASFLTVSRIRPQLRKVLEERPSLRGSLLNRSHRATGPFAPDRPAARAHVGPIEQPFEETLALEEYHEDGRHVLVPVGALELRSVDALEAALSRLWSKRATALTLDLRRVTFIDSSGLWCITSLQKWCAREGIGFMLIPGPEPVHHVFELTGLSDVLPFAPPGVVNAG